MTTPEVSALVLKLIEAANRLDLRKPTKVTRDYLSECLAYLKALRECYQTMHWTSRGENYNSDHQLFNKLYDQLTGQIDALAEKAVGYTDDAYVVDVQFQASRVATHITEIMSHLPDMTNIQCVFNAESKFVKELCPKMLNDIEQAGELSDGLENFLQGLADEHEQIMFHLERRLKTQKDLAELGPSEPSISPPPAPVENVEEEFNTMVNSK